MPTALAVSAVQVGRSGLRIAASVVVGPPGRRIGVGCAGQPRECRQRGLSHIVGDRPARVELEGLDHLTRWNEAMKERPAVVRGRAVPAPPEQSENDTVDVAAMGKKILV